MAKRNQAAAEAVQTTPIQEAAPQAVETVQTPAEQPAADQPQRQFRANPFPIKTTNLGGQRITLQERRPDGQSWQMQIKFGEGAKDDMPSDAVRDLIKSHRLQVETKEGVTKEVQLFHWNDDDRAWGMRIDFKAPATSRQKAEEVYKEVVQLVAQERGVGRER